MKNTFLEHALLDISTDEIIKICQSINLPARKIMHNYEAVESERFELLLAAFYSANWFFFVVPNLGFSFYLFGRYGLLAFLLRVWGGGEGTSKIDNREK